MPPEAEVIQNISWLRDGRDSSGWPEPRIMRYELSHFEWIAIKPMLPNRMRGLRRVNDRGVRIGQAADAGYGYRALT
jgi:hypothetical protein